ncbi:MAG: PAS domain-containing sensor histidine kinase [FCB group bacterium]|jgi:PAS domain S-box-containing protein|nr:PAS domain-containing sensor histidine kinase [FCB group bacterium]
MSNREHANKSQSEPSKGSMTFENVDTADLSPDDLRTLVRNLHGRLAELETQNRDLSKSQEELRLLCQKDLRLYEEAPVACLTVDEHCQITAANAAARALLGVSDQTLKGQSLASLVVPEKREHFLEQCSRILEEGERLSFDTVIELSDGRLRSALFEGVAVRGDDRGPVVLCAVITDVSEQEASEAMLRQSHERLKWMFDLSREGILILDSDMRFEEANPAAGMILGYPRDILLKMGIEDLEPAPGRPGAEHLRGLSESEVTVGEFHFARPDGAVCTVEYSGRGLSDGQFVVFMRDITDQRTAAEQLLQYSEHLEDLVELRAERIRELERYRVQSEQLAATGRMAARIAHEINNPLAGIKNSFLLIKDAIAEDYPYYRYVGAIEKEINRIARIVSQMFDLYQPEQEQPQRFNLGETLEDVLLMLEPLCRQRGVTMAARLPDYPVILFQPEGLVRQVLYNLIANAIESSPADEIVRVTAVPLGENISIAVSDHGEGISEEVAVHLFEPFYTTKRAGAEEGVGLGLSVSRTLVELMRGTLSYQSKVGEGTVFRMILPQSI